MQSAQPFKLALCVTGQNPQDGLLEIGLHLTGTGIALTALAGSEFIHVLGSRAVNQY